MRVPPYVSYETPDPARQDWCVLNLRPDQTDLLADHDRYMMTKASR
jgi:hypothetical protein